MKRRHTASWSQILQTLYDYALEAKEICPFGMQEPLLETRLTAILSSIKQFNRKTKTTLYTNMTIYDEKVWKRIIYQQSLDELNISFYGTSKKVYNTLQPGFNYFQVQKNIKKLVKLRRKLRWNKPFIRMRLIVTPETIGGSKFTAKWRKIVDQVALGFYDGWCGQNEYDQAWETKIWGKPAKRRDPCCRLWGTLTVHADGTVVPCCLDYDNSYPMGHISEPNVFNNKYFQRLRWRHVNGEQNELGLCAKCTLWRYEHPKEWTEYWLTNPATSVVTPYTK